ncbi:M20 aminoacylase family protein [Variovorax boronicumulans]|uniref:M20 aminoacylase family protein n=1 Tax=Variovorax boronicumulans TaxID=436515 RepID=UPI0012E48187|nr:M20 aminoacylase family protein [Variovorax boronicumulans]GER18120.1 amidohydrolase [Variovorax boronicumulans]
MTDTPHDTREVRDWAEAHAGAYTAVRRQIHRHPELGFEEFQTSALVADRLEAWGYQVDRGIGGTGFVAQLKLGDSPRRLGIRAEMDALPMTELAQIPHASQRPGVMHACGHDGHTTMLLFAAQYIAEQRRFDGTLNLIFQPAEEGLNGASRMMQEGLFTRYPCDSVFAMHNMPGLPAGQLLFREGAQMASGDTVVITLTGRGGHGAMPHLATDPTVAAASIVMALQTVVSRNTDPLHAVVVTVGVLQAGTASNVIPETALLKLTVRALDRDARDLAEARIRALVHAQALSFGLEAEVDYQRGYPVLVNTPSETAFARTVARNLVGPQGMVETGPPVMASEDFAFMLEEVPGCYFFIGNGTHIREGGCSVHNPHYDFNDHLLPVGAAYWASLVEQYLPKAG